VIKYEPVFGFTQLQSALLSAFNASLTVFGFFFPILPLVISLRRFRFQRAPLQVLNPKTGKMIVEDEYYSEALSCSNESGGTNDYISLKESVDQV